MAQLQFLDSNGLKSVLNKIKDTFVPKSRKIANIDLNDDITAEELGNNLKDYVDGKSAYEVAIDNGFVGSERRWLESLKGEQGEKGKAFTYNDFTEEQLIALTGPQGEVGPKGESGVYVGSGDMPEDCNVQIDPEGDTFDISDIIDQTYNPESKNAQSGVAVAEAVKEAKDYTDENKITIIHEYFPSSSKAISGMGVAEALRTIKGLVNLGYIYTSTDFANCQFEKGYLYIFTLAAGTKGVKCNNFNFGELTTVHCIGMFDGNYFDFIAPGYGHFYTQLFNGTFSVINLPEAELSTSSLNPVQNKVITQAINEINSQLGDIDTAFDELHTYAQSLITGGASE